MSHLASRGLCYEGWFIYTLTLWIIDAKRMC